MLNRYDTGADGSASQSLERTWPDCVQALRGLGEKVEDLARRTAAIAVTAQGDGTWLVGAGNAPVGDAWLWLDARAAPTVERLSARAAGSGAVRGDRAPASTPASRARRWRIWSGPRRSCSTGAEVALHCKDWLYLNLTGVRATDPVRGELHLRQFPHAPL